MPRFRSPTVHAPRPSTPRSIPLTTERMCRVLPGRGVEVLEIWVVWEFSHSCRRRTGAFRGRESRSCRGDSAGGNSARRGAQAGRGASSAGPARSTDDGAGVDPGLWLRAGRGELAVAQVAGLAAALGREPEFFGARDHAHSFAYVIDCSGSMATRNSLGSRETRVACQS